MHRCRDVCPKRYGVQRMHQDEQVCPQQAGAAQTFTTLAAEVLLAFRPAFSVCILVFRSSSLFCSVYSEHARSINEIIEVSAWIFGDKCSSFYDVLT